MMYQIDEANIKILTTRLINYYQSGSSANLNQVISQVLNVAQKTLNYKSIVNLSFCNLAESSFGDTEQTTKLVKNIKINQILLSANSKALLLITLFHELYHIKQLEEINFNSSQAIQNKSNFETKNKINIPSYYFYYTSNLELNAREFSFKIVDKISNLLKQYKTNDISLQKTIIKHTKITQKYIKKERAKYLKFRSKINYVEQNINNKLNNLNQKLNILLKKPNYLNNKKTSIILNKIFVLTEKQKLILNLTNSEDKKLQTILYKDTANKNNNVCIINNQTSQFSFFDEHIKE